MTPDVVVDIGNSRMKWGACADGRVGDAVALPLDEPTDLERRDWSLGSDAERRSGRLPRVNPQAARNRFVDWLRHARHRRVVTITDHSRFAG